MNLAETLRGLLRRWYIVVPGLIAAIAVAFGAWTVVKPGYERTATQLLIPGQLSLPENANPFLFLGGLSNAADVLVRAVGSETVINDILEDEQGVEVEVSRDGSTSGPVILITVTARSDEQAASVLATLVERTGVELEVLQDAERIPAGNRITVMPITIDDTSTLQQRDRLVATVGAGILVAIIAVVAASLVDGLARQKRRRPSPEDPDADAEEEDAEAGADADADAEDEVPAGDAPEAVSASIHSGDIAPEELIGASPRPAPRKKRPSKVQRTQ